MESKRVKNWAIVCTDNDPFRAPELKAARLHGYLEEEDKTIITSAIQDIQTTDDDKVKLIITRNSRYSIHEDDVEPQYEAIYPNAFARASMNK